jgi:hypothetical protein
MAMDNATKQRLRAKIAELEAGLRPYVVRHPDDDPLRKALRDVVKERKAKGLPVFPHLEKIANGQAK